jgi:elongation factor G
MEPFLIEIAIEPKSRSRRDIEDFEVALNLLAAEDDDGFDIQIDRETGQTIVSGRSELHIEKLVQRLGRKFGVAVNVGRPQVAYRETLGRRMELDYTHKRQSGGSGEFARLKLSFEPGEPGSGYRFENRIVGNAVPREFIRGVRKGLEASCKIGVLAGFPVIDFTATLVDGAYHDVDSSERAFEIAARAAFREGLRKADCKLLEPVMAAEVRVPNAYGKACIDDLTERRGEILRAVERDGALEIDALVPLANLLGFDASLRVLSEKQGTFSLIFHHYAPVPMPPDNDDPFAPAVGMRA